MNKLVIVDLSLTDVAEAQGFFQEQTRKNLIETIKSKVPNNSDMDKKTNNKWESGINLRSGGNSFFVSGTRGAGKSTFLSKTLQEIADLEKKEVYVLPIIDPTRFDTPSGILVSIIGIVNQRVLTYLKTNAHVHSDDYGGDYKLWENTLEKFSRSVRVSGRNTLDEIYDKSMAFNMGMDLSSDLMNISKSIEALFKVALSILNYELFVLAFDDVDTSFKDGWEILETIRVKLDNPYVVTIVSGDLELYSHLIRGKQLENFPEVLFKHDQSHEVERVSMVDHLEQQYLLKLFPISQRFQLNNLMMLLSKGEININIKGYINFLQKPEQEQDKTTSIESYLIQLIKQSLSATKTEVQSYVEHLLMAPIRTLMMVIRNFNHGLEGWAEKDLKTNKIVTSFFNTIKQSFISSIYRYDISVDGDIDRLAYEVFQHVLRVEEVDYGYYLRARNNDEHLNNIDLILATAVSHQLLESGGAKKAIPYLLKGIGSSSVYAQLEDKPSHVDMFINYLGLKKEVDLRYWSTHIGPIILPVKSNTQSGLSIGNGVMRLMRGVPANQPIGKFKVYKLRTEKDSLSQLAARTAWSEVSNNRETMTYISVFNMIATMGQFLGLESSKDIASDNDSFLKGIKAQFGIVEKVSLPLFGGEKSSGFEDFVFDVGEEEEADPSLDWVFEWIDNWLSSVRTLRLNFSVGAYARVWDEFYHNLGRIKEEGVGKYNKNFSNSSSKKAGDVNNVAEIMSFNVMSFLNALMEGNVAFMEKFTVFSGNATTSTNLIFRKIILMQQNMEKNDVDIFEILKKEIPLFYIAATYPLFWPFIHYFVSSGHNAARGAYGKDGRDQVLEFFQNLRNHALSSADNTEIIKNIKDHDEKGYFQNMALALITNISFPPRKESQSKESLDTPEEITTPLESTKRKKEANITEGQDTNSAQMDN